MDPKKNFQEDLRGNFAFWVGGGPWPIFVNDTMKMRQV